MENNSSAVLLHDFFVFIQRNEGVMGVIFAHWVLVNTYEMISYSKAFLTQFNITCL